jgi:hypothetical protein
MAEDARGHFELCNGEVRGWAIEGAAVHLKCVSSHGDPVELNAEELNELIEKLKEVAKLVE